MIDPLSYVTPTPSVTLPACEYGDVMGAVFHKSLPLPEDLYYSDTGHITETIH